MSLASGSPWSPLVAGDAAARALAAAEAIGRDLAADPWAAPGMGVAGGQAGVALFFAYLERALGDGRYGELAMEHLERAAAGLAEPAGQSPGLYGGFAGLAWVLEHLGNGEAAADEEAAEEEEEEDPNAEIDDALLTILGRAPWRGEFDLLGGLVGWGVYALERLPRPTAAAMLPRVVERLAERSEPAGPGVLWPYPTNPLPEPDLGMAHGAAGVIALLARMLREGAANPRAEALLDAAVAGALAQKASGEILGSVEGPEGDLAWCAGDAGLSVALLAAARARGRADWEREGRRLAAASAAGWAEQNRGFDTALCHGTAGLSQLFHRLYRATGDPALLAAAHRWLERTLAEHHPGQGIGGYLCRGKQADGTLGWSPNPGFLGGAAGIGLALLAAASPVEPGWDRLLLLSGALP